MTSEDLLSIKHELINAGKDFYQRGWSLATSSNYSYRISRDTILITASGRHKGMLTEKDFLKTDLSAIPLESSNVNPSAETLLHCHIYSLFSEVKCVLHVHSLYASMLAAAMVDQGQTCVRFEGLEMQKALNVKTHDCVVEVPVVSNSQNMKEIIEDLELHHKDRLREVPGYFIAGHGIYAWSDSIIATRSKIEAFEYLAEFFLKRHDKSSVT